MIPATGTPPFQIGTLARDAQAARDRHDRCFGVRPWIGSGWGRTQFWDGVTNEIVEIRYRAMFGRLTDDLALEFIEVDPLTPAPRVWDLDQAQATAHLGYWCRDTRAAAEELIALGGTIVLARVSSPELGAALLARATGEPLPAGLDMCYIATAEGLLVELVPAAIWGGRLRASFGDGIDNVLAAPSRELLA
jgi:Glyoxalase/Bleomycin resistance protein/Dioxygenase superfamily